MSSYLTKCIGFLSSFTQCWIKVVNHLFICIVWCLINQSHHYGKSFSKSNSGFVEWFNVLMKHAYDTRQSRGLRTQQITLFEVKVRFIGIRPG